jgi:hypothetical protein
MRIRSRRASSPVWVVAVAAALTIAWGGAVALAAEEEPGDPPPIEGIVYDGVLTVTFSADADGFGFATGDPLPDAEVLVVASVADAAVKVDRIAWTGDDGVAVLEELPRPETGGPAVSLDVVAEWRSETPRVDGCIDVDAFIGDATVDGGPSVAVGLAGAPTSWTDCGEPSPEPEPGLAWDASLVVTFLDADGAPIGGADVTLIGERPGAEGETTSFYKTAGTTEADGAATFADLPRATDEADAEGVSWWVEALASDATDVDGCAYGAVLQGGTRIEDPVAGGQTATITAEATEPEWGACEEPGEGAPVVTVVALGLPDDGTDGGGASPEPVPSDDPTATAEPGDGGADGNGSGSTDPAAALAPAAVAGGWVEATQTRADGASWSAGEVELVDGVAEVRVQAWGAAPVTSSLVIRVQGPYLRSETDGDCTVDIVLAGETTVEASFATDPPDAVEVELVETRVEAGCGGSTPPVDATDGEGTGGPDKGGDGSELPATDAARAAIAPSGADVGGGPGLAIALGLGGLVAGIGATFVRRRTARA